MDGKYVSDLHNVKVRECPRVNGLMFGTLYTIFFLASNVNEKSFPILPLSNHFKIRDYKGKVSAIIFTAKRKGHNNTGKLIVLFSHSITSTPLPPSLHVVDVLRNVDECTVRLSFDKSSQQRLFSYIYFSRRKTGEPAINKN